MIVVRDILNIKRGCMREAVGLAREEAAAERQRSGVSRGMRLYVARTGKSRRLSVEFEYENLADYEKRVAEWLARPTTAAFLEKWHATFDDESVEIWAVPD
jgi:hypothetical protein